MIIRIDAERDIVRILFREVPIEESDKLSDGMIVDYDEEGLIVGMEFLSASQKFRDLQKLEIKGRKANFDTRRGKNHRPLPPNNLLAPV